MKRRYLPTAMLSILLFCPLIAGSSSDGLYVPTKTLWDNIAADFSLTDVRHPSIDVHHRWLNNHPDYLPRISEYARPFLHYVYTQVKERDLPTEIALLPIVESAFLPYAYSSEHAAGIWQFTPLTGKQYGLRQNFWVDERRHIVQSTNAALDYLTYLHGYFDGDWLLAIAAYNSGETRVLRAIKHNEKRGLPTDFWHLQLPKETRHYVPRLLAVAQTVAKYRQRGITLANIPNRPYLDVVTLHSQIDISLVATLSGVDIETIYALNPGFNRWATPPGGSELALPVGAKKHFQRQLAMYPQETLAEWRTHIVETGDNLSVVAAEYNTTVQLLKQVNSLDSSVIHRGQQLIIPIPKKPIEEYLYALQPWERKLLGKHIHRHMHIVQPGESLWSIADQYQVSIAALARWNRLDQDDPLSVDTTLVIWRYSKPPIDSAAHSLSLPNELLSHTVLNGETIADISTQYGIDAQTLLQINGLPVDDMYMPLAEGTNIVFPGAMVRAANIDALAEVMAYKQKMTYRVRRGDSLWKIAKQFNVSVNEIAQWNQISSVNRVYPKQQLVVFIGGTL